MEQAAYIFVNKILIDNSPIDKELQILFYDYIYDYIVNYHFVKDQVIFIPLLLQRGFPSKNLDIIGYYHNLIYHSLIELGEFIKENKTKNKMDKFEKISRASITAVTSNYISKELVFIYVESSKYLTRDDIIYLQKKFQKLLDCNPKLSNPVPRLYEFLKICF